jgi:NAD(P)-dependent dehydrogenase (short-subunit alcohol dehydrogenase family)
MSSVLQSFRALIIGGSSGIGLESARMLARDGAHVTIAGRSTARLSGAASVLADEGLEVATVEADALSAGDVSRAVEVASAGEGLDAAVVVPGGGSITPVLMYEDDQFSQEIDLNVRPVFLALRYAGRAMIRNGSGSFVAISSTAAAFSTRYLASYSAGKAAVDQLIRVAADELGSVGVRVNGVRPGFTKTATTAAAFSNPQMVQAFLDQQALGRSGETSDVAHAVRYLVGPESAWVTGQLLTVDGGNTLRAFVNYAEIMDIPDYAEWANEDASVTAANEDASVTAGRLDTRSEPA